MERIKNEKIAVMLEEVASLLETQEANPHRVRAYRNAAGTIRSLDRPLDDLYQEAGRERLESLPSIGESLAGLIEQVLQTGRSDLLDRLRGQVSPRELFAEVPGIGETLADRIVDELDIETLPELEQAAHDGRLEQVEGFGEQRVETVRIALAGLLSRAVQRRVQSGPQDRQVDPPPVNILLQVDAEYRQRAQAGDLRTIAPRRFNPEGEAWLPIMEVNKEGWRFTALYSNTARAHDLGKTHDWVVIYYERDGQENQATVVTETSGPLEGRRVVRGRETECRDYHLSQ